MTLPTAVLTAIVAKAINQLPTFMPLITGTVF